MEGATATLPRKSPRWWRQFVVASRRANIFRYLEIAAVLAVAAMIYATWYSFTHAPAGGQLLPSAQVATLLIGTLIPSLALIVLFGRRMALRRAAGSTARLHVRLVFFFSMVAAVPTLLVAGFAAFLFQSGVDFWFSDNSRGLMRNYLEMAGYRVVEAGSCEEAFERLSRDGADMVVTSLDLGAPFELLRKLRTSPELAAIPTLALSSSVEESARCAEQDVQFDDYQLKFDRASMLHSIEKLAAAVDELEPAAAAGGRA